MENKNKNKSVLMMAFILLKFNVDLFLLVVFSLIVNN